MSEDFRQNEILALIVHRNFRDQCLSLRESNSSFSGYFYSASSSPLLLRGAPDYSTDTVSEFASKRHRQLQVKDLPKVPTWRLERESNSLPFRRKASILPMGDHAPRVYVYLSACLSACPFFCLSFCMFICV